MGVEISTAIRTALIPNAALINRPLRPPVPASALVLAVEVWSPGNSVHERENKVAGYAIADLPYLWTVELHAVRQAAAVGAYKLVDDRFQHHTYIPE